MDGDAKGLISADQRDARITRLVAAVVSHVDRNLAATDSGGAPVAVSLRRKGLFRLYQKARRAGRGRENQICLLDEHCLYRLHPYGLLLLAGTAECRQDEKRDKRIFLHSANYFFVNDER